MIQVLLDLLGYLEQKFNTTTNNVDWTKIQLVRSGTITSFTERFEDDVTGWGMGLGLKIPFDYSNCNLPIT